MLNGIIPNGIFTEIACKVHLVFRQLITPWFPNPPAFTYLEYDGNRGTVSVSAHVAALKGRICPQTGDPFFDIRDHLRRSEIRSASPMTTAAMSGRSGIQTMWAWLHAASAQ
jgi:hypothetical protein